MNGTVPMCRRGRAGVLPLADHPDPRRPCPDGDRRWPHAADRPKTRPDWPRRSTPPSSGWVRLQPLLDDPEVENIDINGYDHVFVQYGDGREERHAEVAESDEELVELIQVLAAHTGLASRPFDSANPQLDLRLPDGSRLSAVMNVCSRPSVSIRKARLGRVFLDDLIANSDRDSRARVIPEGCRSGAQEHHDRRFDQRRKNHHAARARQRDPSVGTARHR